MINKNNFVLVIAMGVCLISITIWAGLVVMYLIGVGRAFLAKIRVHGQGVRGSQDDSMLSDRVECEGWPLWVRLILGCFALSWGGVLVLLIPIIAPILPHGVGLVYGLAAFCASLGLACLFQRTRPVTLRIVGFLIFYVCVGYVLDMIGKPFEEDKPNILKALKALVVFGLPGAFLAVGGTRGFMNWVYLVEKYIYPIYYGRTMVKPDYEGDRAVSSRPIWSENQAGAGESLTPPQDQDDELGLSDRRRIH